MRTETKTATSTWYIFNVQGVHTLIFTYVPYIIFGLHEETANF